MSARERQAPAERQRHAVDAFRDAIERLSDDWHSQGADGAAHADAGDLHVLSESDEESALSIDKRILLISLELGVVGAALETAVESMIQTDDIRALKKLADARSAGHPVVDYVRETLHSSDNIAQRVRDEATDPKLLEALVDGAGLSAVEPLLDALIESPSRAVRRTAFDLLKKLGMPAGLAAVTRLEGQPWYVLRNLLVLAQSLDTVPAGVDPLPLLFHEDARVRKEAFPVCLRAVDGRTPSLKAGLADEDERILMMALREAREDLPGMLVPEVAQHVEKGGDIAQQAVYALGGSHSPLALKALLDVCQGRRLLGGVRLHKKSPELLLALGILRERWGDVDEVRAVLQEARTSKDDDVRAAAGGDD
jgi:HEAT repeat protein